MRTVFALRGKPIEHANLTVVFTAISMRSVFAFTSIDLAHGIPASRRIFSMDHQTFMTSNLNVMLITIPTGLYRIPASIDLTRPLSFLYGVHMVLFCQGRICIIIPPTRANE
ncbi:MAG TPA: hypothetical protein DIT99_08515 [Candidatus Latescibacteria bacterium]|nr:hypothetical protein [Candidatus Latescibacterota bacterium]